MDIIPWYKLVMDLVLLASLGAVFFCLKYLITPAKTGFYCNDYSVNLPFRSSTVNNIWLFVISFLVPCLFIIGTELGRDVYVRIKRKLRRKRRSNDDDSEVVEFAQSESVSNAEF